VTRPPRRATVVVDLGFGDAGKGTVVDHLVRTRRAGLVVRFHGGAQAGHNVVLADGRHHTFAQLGAGSFVPGVRTFLAAPFVLHPTALCVEARVLAQKGVPDPLARLSIAGSARVITPFHQAANRLRELARGAARHGSCGVGVGETVRDALEHPHDAMRARDLTRGTAHVNRILDRIAERLRVSLGHAFRTPGEIAEQERAAWDNPTLAARWHDATRPMHGCIGADSPAPGAWDSGDVVLEGAQGVLLDEQLGFHPHTTWSDCTSHAASGLLASLGWDGEVHRLGVLRTYLTRHGEGPLPTHAPSLDVLPEPHNASDGWQGAFRRGWPDLVLARYALAGSPVDALAITHLDALRGFERWSLATSWSARDVDTTTLLTLTDLDARGRVVTLRVGDLDHQARLATLLMRVQPQYDAFPADAATLMARLEDALQLPITLTSHGPTPGDKRARG
jgi:adenylosuccinate synthase